MAKMYETHKNHWNDSYNDVFIDLRNKRYEVSERLPGNNRHVWADFAHLSSAMSLALRLSKCKD